MGDTAIAIAEAFITMSMRETDRLKTIQAVVDRMARVGQAAPQFDLARHPLERLVKHYIKKALRVET